MVISRCVLILKKEVTLSNSVHDMNWGGCHGFSRGIYGRAEIMYGGS